MPNTTLWVLAALAATAVVAAALWWRHRRRLAEMERKLAWSEASRFELEHQVQAADEKLSALTRAVQDQQTALESARELAERRAAVERLLAEAPAPPAAGATEWPDTLPFGPPGFRYVETMPAELGSAEPPKPRR